MLGEIEIMASVFTKEGKVSKACVKREFSKFVLEATIHFDIRKNPRTPRDCELVAGQYANNGKYTISSVANTLDDARLEAERLLNRHYRSLTNVRIYEKADTYIEDSGMPEYKYKSVIRWGMDESTLESVVENFMNWSQYTFFSNDFGRAKAGWSPLGSIREVE
jgi:hypothetical protein